MNLEAVCKELPLGVAVEWRAFQAKHHRRMYIVPRRHTADPADCARFEAQLRELDLLRAGEDARFVVIHRGASAAIVYLIPSRVTRKVLAGLQFTASTPELVDRVLAAEQQRKTLRRGKAKRLLAVAGLTAVA